ncbi:MAG: formimidoylglutamate deiminase [Acidimicrobiia bacterium]|nr:formimidoylglutamate deiminase [Acidimicrobiia bacterium]
MTTFHCQLAWLGDAAADVERDLAVHVDGDRIAAVEAGVAPSAGAVRLPGLTVPGFANAHSHAFHRALRGRTHGGRGSFWTWRRQMYDVAATLDPDTYLLLARATFAEMVLAGISCVGEFHYLHHDVDGRPYGDPNEMGHAVLQAATEAGLRITLLDTCYLQGGFGRPPDGVQRRFSDGDADAWAARVGAITPGSGARVGAAIHSVRAVDPASMAAVASWATEHATALHAHVSEQPIENEQCRATHGATPTELLDAAGALGERFTAVHAIHLTDHDVQLLGGQQCSCCCCPTTERDLADGIGPWRALDDAGARLTIGSDSHAVIDALEEARGVELHERLRTSERGHHRPADLLQMAGRNGHLSLGWPDAGVIAPGALADLTTVGLDSVRTVGADESSALATVVFAATAADVRHVVVGGRVVVADGHHTTIDAATELRAALRALP